MIRNYIIGGLILIIIVGVFLGNNYMDERLNSAEKELTQQYESKLNTYRQQLDRSKLERDSLDIILIDQYIHIKNLERIDSMYRSTPVKTYNELKNIELQNRMLEIYKKQKNGNIF